jgi:hypothetical protein
MVENAWYEEESGIQSAAKIDPFSWFPDWEIPLRIQASPDLR